MATALDVISLALKDIGVLAAGESAESSDAADALDTLNQMLVLWEAQGISLGFGEVALATEVNVPKYATLAIRHNLAVLLAPSYDVRVDAVLGSFAQEGKETLRGFSMEPQEVSFDHLPGIYRRYDINQG
jgi:hypothetical protein